MPATNSQNKQSLHRATVELTNYGRLLDLMEVGKVALSAHQYRKAAVFSLKLIKTHFDQDFVLDACAGSPALAELRDNVVMEAAAHRGQVGWLYDFRALGSKQ
jgi:hypothetical protein